MVPELRNEPSIDSRPIGVERFYSLLLRADQRLRERMEVTFRGAALAGLRSFSALTGMRADDFAARGLGEARLALSASIRSITCARGCSASAVISSPPSIFF